MRIALLLALLATSPAVLADNCRIELSSNDQMIFDKPSVTVSARCPEIEITLTHTGSLPVTAMGHNVVISPTDLWQAAAQDGLKAGAGNHYVTPGDSRVIAHTDLIGGGGTTAARFPGSRLSAGSAYTFYCSFPGHWALMKGELIVE